MFESNQSGIETCVRSVFARRVRSLNRTRVELKPLFPAMLRSWQGVWIEPEWNWNTRYVLMDSYLSGLNRTRVELKQGKRRNLLKLRVGLNRTRVELKPFPLRCAVSRSRPFESNQSGIETMVSNFFSAFNNMFESNQSGIETFRQTPCRILL